MLVCPTRLFAPTSLQARLVGAALGTGSAALNSEQGFVDVAGGGRWMLEFGEATLRTRDLVLAWRRMVTLLDGGATPILVPLADRRHQPINPQYTGTDTFGLDTWVDDPTSWSPVEVTAPLSADAALGATELSFALTAPLRLQGGERLSILHSTYSWRIYEIGRVKTGGTVGSAVATTVTIRPPLREAVSSGDQLNLESPRGVFQSVGDLSETLTMLRIGKGQARFVEWPGPP